VTVEILALLGDALRVVLAAIFLYLGYFDVRPSVARKEEFRRWGLPTWVQPTGGVFQLASVALLILPGTTLYAAAIIVVMMLFSGYVHLAREYRPKATLWPASLAVLAVVVGLLYGTAAVGPAGWLFRALVGLLG
jgi:uncharacterized membrane protein YphA (DoxX/SURF4 family)